TEPVDLLRLRRDLPRLPVLARSAAEAAVRDEVPLLRIQFGHGYALARAPRRSRPGFGTISTPIAEKLGPCPLPIDAPGPVGAASKQRTRNARHRGFAPFCEPTRIPTFAPSLISASLSLVHV